MEESYYEEEFKSGGAAKPGSGYKEFTVEAHFKRPLISFSTAKQITDECEKILKDNFGDGNIVTPGKDDADMQHAFKLLNFKDLLSWKMPEHFCTTTSANNKQYNRHRLEGGGDQDSGIVGNQINLYKLDFVTQRLKEQRVNFVGIVTHIKSYVRLFDLFNHSIVREISQSLREWLRNGRQFLGHDE